MTLSRWSRIRAFVAFAVLCASVLAGCNPQPDHPRTPRTLEEALSRTYHERTLRELLLDAGASPRGPGTAVLALHTALGVDAGTWLAAAIRAGIPPSRKTAFSLLDSDVDGARAARDLLVQWMTEEPDGARRVDMARLLLEVDPTDAGARDAFLRPLREDKDADAIERVILGVWALGKAGHLYAEEFVAFAERRPDTAWLETIINYMGEVGPLDARLQSRVDALRRIRDARPFRIDYGGK